MTLTKNDILGRLQTELGFPKCKSIVNSLNQVVPDSDEGDSSALPGPRN
jgi:hypothetical protein